MSRSYRNITPRLAGQIRLLMTDVDGTITPGGDSLSLAVLDAINCLKGEGIMVGLVSGRMLFRLESMARDLGITGSIIAENGGVAKPAIAAFHRGRGASIGNTKAPRGN